MADWDKIKGFFRRQTQFVNQTYRQKGEPTLDTEYENLLTIVDGLRNLAVRTSERCKRLATAVDATVNVIHEASIDPPPQEFQWEDMKKLNVKLSFAAQNLSPHGGYAKKVLVEHAALLDRFISDVNNLNHIKEERKATVLEYDFFRHKVSALRADPPSDPQRIPRNEGRVMEFKEKYEALNTRLKQVLTGLMSTGERLCTQAHQMMAVELNRYAEESCRAWKGANIVAEKAAVSKMAANTAAAASSSSSSTVVAPTTPTTVHNQQVAPAPVAQQQQQQQLPNDYQQPPQQDNKAWNQTQSTFNFNQQQEQQQDNLASTTNTLNSTVDYSSTNNNQQQQPNNNTTLASPPSRPPPVATPKEKGSRTAKTEDDPFRM